MTERRNTRATAPRYSNDQVLETQNSSNQTLEGEPYEQPSRRFRNLSAGSSPLETEEGGGAATPESGGYGSDPERSESNRWTLVGPPTRRPTSSAQGGIGNQLATAIPAGRRRQDASNLVTN
jgi:hypothetical protein